MLHEIYCPHLSWICNLFFCKYFCVHQHFGIICAVELWLVHHIILLYLMLLLFSWVPQHRHTYHDLSDSTSPLLTPTTQPYLPWSIRCYFSSPDSHNTDILTMIYQMLLLLSWVPQHRHTYHDLSDATSPLLCPTKSYVVYLFGNKVDQNGYKWYI